VVKSNNKRKKRNINKNKIKHGQVTIFIVISIIIVIIIIAFFIFGSFGFSLRNLINSDEANQVQDYITSCIKETGKNAIIYNGIHGGYYILNYTTPGGTPYYYDYNSSQYLIPTKQELEKQLGLFMNVYLNSCDLTQFHDIEISMGEINTRAKIQDNKVIFNVNYPITITKGNRTSYLKNFNDISIPVRLGVINYAISDYFNQSYVHPNGICMTCLYNIGKKNSLYFELYDYDNETVLFLVRDKKVPVGNYTSYQFDFAAKYPRVNHLTKDSNITIKQNE